jgi:ankyrin repeat protein
VNNDSKLIITGKYFLSLTASAKGHKDIVELLLSKGANINEKNNGGKTPIDFGW